MGPLLRRQLGATEFLPGRGRWKPNNRRIWRVIVMEAYIDSRPGQYGALSNVLISAARWMSNTSLVVHDTLCVWSERLRQRRQLLSLSDQMLSDIGVSRVDAFKECEKPFWRP
jgi:uncharacterized protein YjiS (DUF1127 family)